MGYSGDNSLEARPKRVVKVLISACVFGAMTSIEALGKLFGYRPRGCCTVLYYHDIPLVHRDRFAHQLNILCTLARIVSVDDSTHTKRGQRSAMITFDDGFETVLQHALPELATRSIPCVIFVCSDLLGETPGWEGYPGRLMSLDQLQNLPLDLVSIGSHT